MIKTLLFPATVMAIFLILTVVSIIFDGTIKKGWRRVGKALLVPFVMSLLYFWVATVLIFLYPLFSEYWKLLGTGVLLATGGFPLAGILVSLDESIREDQIKDLAKLGWRKVTMRDYATYSEYSNDSGYMKLFHPSYGKLTLGEAKKTE